MPFFTFLDDLVKQFELALLKFSTTFDQGNFMSKFFLFFAEELSGEYFKTSLKAIYFLKGLLDIFPVLDIKTNVFMIHKSY